MIKLSEEERIMERRERKNRAAWERIVREQKQSGMTAVAFCRREDLGLSNFYHWKRRLSEEGTPESSTSRELFIDMGQLGGGGMLAAGGDSLEVTLDLGNGARLTLRRG